MAAYGTATFVQPLHKSMLLPCLRLHDSMEIRENRLAKEKSPYLLQHAFNPVDWYPWGEEAFDKARREDRPVFLSIGYSTCHWCHVMERESFSDPDVARLLNDAFVCVKVDREERPDIDAVYMSVCQELTGSGGWPLTIVMTPEKQPFFAATYVPKERRFGIAGLIEIVPRIMSAWHDRRKEIVESAGGLVAALNAPARHHRDKELSRDVLGKAYAELAARYDDVHGGFGGAPKFPSPHNLLFLLRYWHRTRDNLALEMVERTLQAMRMGGIYDHLGFGFHRYSTDAEWFVPHFEKMLYDQAMMSKVYIEAFQITGKEEYARTAREIFEYIERDMTSKDGGFFSAEDADSDGVEGKFYLWTLREVMALLPEEEAAPAIDYFSLMKEGNFESDAHRTRPGVNILRMLETLPATAARLKIPQDVLARRLETARKMLFEAREERVHPRKDDKILADWNGLMIAAFAIGSRVLDDQRYARIAGRAADFVLTKMRDGQRRLLHRYRDGEAAIPGNLDDYAFMLLALIELYEATFNSRWLRESLELACDLIEHFLDKDNGGFFFTADDAERILVRQKPIHDGAIPSGNSVALDVLLRLGRMTGDANLEALADGLIMAFSEEVKGQPSVHTGFISAIDFALGPSFEVVIAGNPDSHDTQELARALRTRFLPSAVVLLRPSSGSEIEVLAPYIKDFGDLNGKAAVYVCTHHACKLPTTEIPRMLELLGIRDGEDIRSA